jgi:cell division protein FtsL
MTERSEQLISMFLQDPSVMTDGQMRDLSNWICRDVGNTREFIQASLFHRCIHDALLGSDEARNSILQGDMNTQNMKAESFFDKRFWEVLLKEEATAPRVEIEKPSILEKEVIQKVVHEKVVRKVNKATFLTFIVAAAAMISMIIYVTLVPNTTNVEVATLTDTLNAQWAESSVPAGSNTRLMTNHAPLMLRKGYAELVFDNNAKIVLEAPVEFQVLSYDQIKLTYGRLYATVPTESIGFIVSTPNSKIIDLGTEFGVQADINGATELYVLKGKTSLISGLENNKKNILVNAGSAKRISSNLSETIDIACNEKMFVRQIDSQSQFVWRGQNISLADVVGGGNGFGTGQLDRGIDPSTGNAAQTLSRLEVFAGPKGYIPVSCNPYIDGVFAPGKDSGPAKITSSGLQTAEFPKTSGEIWGYIFNGAWHQSADTLRHHLQLDGVILDGRENPALTMHSNVGITFNLSAIREALPGVRIKSFSSVFGVSQTTEEKLKAYDFSAGKVAQMPGIEKLAAQRHSTAEFWVFLDGKKVLQQKATGGSKAGTIDIQIDQSVRFLTLAVTEADDTFMFDWAVFSRPLLILESAGK